MKYIISIDGRILFARTSNIITTIIESMIWMHIRDPCISFEVLDKFCIDVIESESTLQMHGTYD